MGRAPARGCPSLSPASVAFATAAALAVTSLDAPARADDAEPRARAETPDIAASASKAGYAQVFVSAMTGTGLRFNNPYRLATPLGDDAESLSRTAAYVDIGLGLTFGDPLGLQHGAAIRTTAAVEGVGQVVMTPSYFAWRRWHSLAAFGRAGIALVATPDVTWGLEASGGGAWFFLGGLGVVGEIVGNVFYGAGTTERSTTSYPVLSGQLGLLGTIEVLP